MAENIKRTNRIRDMLRDESGVIAVIFAICIPLFVALAALAIDMAYAYKVRNTVQVTASAAALAGVSQLDDANGNDDPNDDASLGVGTSQNYRREAIEYAYRNVPNNGAIVNSECNGNFVYDAGVSDVNSPDDECADIKAGHWDGAQFFAWDNTAADGCVPGTGCYEPAAMDLDAVQVAARRADANTNPLPLFFAGALGLVDTDVNTIAVATTGGGDITNGCLIALNNDDGADQTFYINGTATVRTVGCDIRVDQCCTDESSCKMGAFRANGTPDIDVIAAACPEEDPNCANEAGLIDICGTLLSQGAVEIDATTNCTPDEGSNYYGDDQCNEPSGDSFDPLQEYADDPVNDWVGLGAANCDFIDFNVTDLIDAGFRSANGFADTDAVQDPDTGIWTFTLHPGVYCGPNGTDPGGKNDTALKFSGGGTDPIIIFSNEAGPGWPTDPGYEVVGLYVIKNGAMDFAASAGSIECDECGFFLTGYPAELEITGSNNLTLSASGDEASPLQGLIIVQDPNNPPTPEDQPIFIAGSTGGSYSGGIYVPNGDITVTGNSESDRDATDCLVIIADELSFEGGATVNANSSCVTGSGPEFAPAPLFFTLVN